MTTATLTGPLDALHRPPTLALLVAATGVSAVTLRKALTIDVQRPGIPQTDHFTFPSWTNTSEDRQGLGQQSRVLAPKARWIR